MDYREKEIRNMKAKFPWILDFNKYSNPWGDKIKPLGKSTRRDRIAFKANGYKWDGYYWSQSKRA